MRTTCRRRASLLALFGTLLELPSGPVEAATRKPDIVLIYLDDFAPYPTRLWEQPARTPELARFARTGLTFEHAIASTPICGPSRANLLTGRYGHNTGVTQNTIGPYDPTQSVSPRLRAAGYKTAFIGKHINRLQSRYPTRRSMARLASKWDRFDVIWEDQGRAFGWTPVPQERHARVRPGQPTSIRPSWPPSVRPQHIDKSKRRTPLFMTVSLTDGHKPADPAPPLPGPSGLPEHRQLGRAGLQRGRRVGQAHVTCARHPSCRCSATPCAGAVSSR